MLLTIDAGNTNTVFAVFNGETLVSQWRMATQPRHTADEYGIWLLQLLAHKRLKPESISAAIAASVVPQAQFELKSLCQRYFNCELRMVGADNMQTGIVARVDRPHEVGADRLVNAFAAWRRHGVPLIVVDFGTATTFDIVNAKGEYIGGVIAPGVNLSLDTLHRAAAKLPDVAVAHPARVIGTDTVSAMQSGIYFGYVGLIEGIVSRICGEYGARMKVIATGGLAPLYAKAAAVIEALEPDLTLWGLQGIYALNNEKEK
ncbi:MAG: type III pantothenate kinase [Alphaproteobacteria bacterium]|nr:type III pantothenate kinase [Alphaproteobacteria bacterium]